MNARAAADEDSAVPRAITLARTEPMDIELREITDAAEVDRYTIKVALYRGGKLLGTALLMAAVVDGKASAYKWGGEGKHWQLWADAELRSRHAVGGSGGWPGSKAIQEGGAKVLQAVLQERQDSTSSRLTLPDWYGQVMFTGKLVRVKVEPR